MSGVATTNVAQVVRFCKALEAICAIDPVSDTDLSGALDAFQSCQELASEALKYAKVEGIPIRGIGWRADCRKCVASKFTCDEHFVPDNR